MISSVTVRGGTKFIMDNKGRTTASLPNGGEVLSVTGESVSVRRGNVVYIYNEKGLTQSTYQYTGNK